MKKYGKLITAERIESTVFLTFEAGKMEVQVLTDRIVRFFSAMQEELPVSKAIEGDKCLSPSFKVILRLGRVEINTGKIVINIADDGFTDIYDSNGTALCLDYRGARTLGREINKEAAELLEQEGHNVQKVAGTHNIQIIKQMMGDECFYGLGDKTGFLNKRGYNYCNWNTDNPQPHVDSFTQLYKSIPFFITLRKNAVFGLFFDNSFRSCFDMGKESDEYYWFGADQGNLDYYFIGGSNMKEIIQGYTYLTGRAPLPQMWTLGYHQSRWGYRCEEDVRRIAKKMRENDVPCDVIHLDIDYMDAYKVFTIDEKKFPNMRQLTEDLAELGIRLVTIMDPGVKVEQGYNIYEEGIENRYFAVHPSGEVYENVVWPGDAVYPDFGREEVREWWGKNYKLLTDNGIAGIWMDMNEPASFEGEIPGDIVFCDEERKSTHAEQHNLYGHNMARATYAGLRELTGKRPFVITRACYSGSQKYTVGWTGDNHSIWAHLQMAIPQMCNLGVSGMPYVGTDIAGFGSDTTKELFCRWIQVGCFSPLCRNHSSIGTKAQEPWELGEEALSIYRKYLKLRYMLLPYYYDLCKLEEEEGIPMLRPLVLNYEKDDNVKNMNTQFMLGDSILVAPVVEQGMNQKLVYLPEGNWYDFWTREKLEGNRYIIKEAPLDECPMYVKEGSIIPMYAPRLSVSKEKDDALFLAVYSDDCECEYVHYQDNGEDFAYLNGEYNLYSFKYQNNKLSTKMLHQGYADTYKTIQLADTEMINTI